MKWTSVISPASISALRFDFDGVSPPTAKVHTRGRKLTFVKSPWEWFTAYSTAVGPPASTTDNQQDVNSTPGDDRIHSFLCASQGDFPGGTPGDPPELPAESDWVSASIASRRPKNVAPRGPTLFYKRSENWSKTPC